MMVNPAPHTKFRTDPRILAQRQQAARLQSGRLEQHDCAETHLRTRTPKIHQDSQSLRKKLIVPTQPKRLQEICNRDLNLET
jgi:hypothetical protein